MEKDPMASPQDTCPPSQRPELPCVSYGLLGRTLKHSWSAPIHEQLGSVPYTLVELEPDELAGYVRHGSWQGLNVTIPYKQDVMPLCDELSDAARRLGAVNTLVRTPEGRIRGENTDLFGFSWLLRRFCTEHFGGTMAICDSEVLVLGSGGASRAVVAALTDLGAVPHVISRTGDDTYEELLDHHAGASLIVNTTPVGMYPKCPESPLSEETLAALPCLRGVLDVVYNPELTSLCLMARKLGIPYCSGLPMLVAQAWESSCLWQGRELDEGLIDQIEHSLRRQTRNVVLIGMPGSGKSSCARELGRICGRKVVDLDEAFEQKFYRSAAEVIEQEGENAFREMETLVLAGYARDNGLVIACGGGVVTRPANLDLMRQNGLVVMLDRRLEELSSKGRPLSQARGIDALARERMPLYRAWADHVVPCTGTARGDAEEIARLLQI